MRFWHKKPRGRLPSQGAVRGAPAFSYYQNRSTPEQPKTERQKPTRWLHNLPGYIATAVIAGCLMYSMTLTTTPKVIVVNDQDKAVQPFLRRPEDYRSSFAELQKKSIFNTNKLTINTTKLAEEYRNTLPEATDVSITLPLLGRNPVVYVRIAAPTLLLQTKTNQAFVIDEQGKSVASADQLPDVSSLNLMLVKDDTGIEIQSNTSVLPLSQVNFLKDVRAELAAANKQVDFVELPPSPNEAHIYLKGVKYYVKYDLQGESREQTGRFLALIRYLTKHHSKSITYIDVRVKERAYVR